MTLDDISATMADVMWHEEHLWKSVYSNAYTFPILFNMDDR
jgi:hypothetical protein